jgi:hypothetical protein
MITEGGRSEGSVRSRSHNPGDGFTVKGRSARSHHHAGGEHNVSPVRTT